MAITKTSPTVVIISLDTAPRSMPEPSMSVCRLGSARIRKMSPAGAAIRRDTAIGWPSVITAPHPGCRQRMLCRFLGDPLRKDPVSRKNVALHGQKLSDRDGGAVEPPG